jgi:hydroxymethylbilane synthase
MRLRLAARSSDLARLQAYQVARALKEKQKNLEIEFIFKTSLGDQNLDVPLASWGSKGVFTQDFYEDLKSGAYDMVVHSWKDLPTEPREGTVIAGTLERADMRDLFLLPNTAWENAKLSGKLEILSSSPRRCYNLRTFKDYLPKGIDAIEFKNVRGNIPTRIGKMVGENCGLILAKAALDRLLTAPEAEFTEVQNKLRDQLKLCRFMVIPLSLSPAAAAQGALAVEVATKNEKVLALLKKINHESTFNAVEEEREILKSYGGGCHQKIGVSVLQKPAGLWKIITGVTDAGQVLDQNKLYRDDPEFPKALPSQVFPLKPEENKWFERENLKVNKIDAKALWVARAEAWPEGLKFDGPVWTSGLKSWQRLAGRGVWVNGCAEGLGDENPRTDALLGPQNWLKLTHESAGQTNAVATYKLNAKPKETSPNLTGKTHFFWMSGSAFERALELYPNEVQSGYHGSGPGLTFQAVNAHKGLVHKPKMFLDLESFLEEVLPS